MQTTFSVPMLRRAVRRLPPDVPRVHPGKWYATQHEHWLGWLGEYEGPGAYGRQVDENRDARYVYNHIVEWRMLIWLAEAAGIDARVVRSAKRAAGGAGSMQSGAAEVRRTVPWEMLEAHLREVLKS